MTDSRALFVFYGQEVSTADYLPGYCADDISSST